MPYLCKIFGAGLLRAKREVDRRFGRTKQAKRDLVNGTFQETNRRNPLSFLLIPFKIEKIRSHREVVAHVAGLYTQHLFDLLGSGWVRVEHGMFCRGMQGYVYRMGARVEADREGGWLDDRINASNVKESKRIWQCISREPGTRSASPAWVPIDWQLDFKSGYRWSEQTWYRDVRFGDHLGIDVKVPWELGRMQHLVWLAWAYVLAKQGLQNISGPDLYRAQFRNQVLDFIAQNPPRFGVQWACTMDVAIRVSNWLVAYDLFRAYGATFDGPFARVFARSVYEHGLHIVRNLEWAVRLRHNHYLANIVGLLFVAAYLPATTETDTWLAFAIEELIHEVRAQFHPEGSNFEGSVCYHRLSAEMVVYATALVLGLPAKRLRAVRAVSLDTALRQMGLEAFLIRLCRLSDRAEDRLPKSASPASGASVFPSWYFERLERMAEFTMHVTKPNGHVAQIGDNDSGRFLKVMPAGRRLSAREAKAAHSNLNDRYGMSEDDPYWMEDHLDHAHLVGAVSGPFDRKEFIEFGGANSLDRALVQSLAGGRRIESYLSRGERTVADGTTIGSVATSRQLTEHLRKSKGYARQAIEFVPPRGTADQGSLLTDLKRYGYPAFGVYIFRSQRLFLVIRCGDVGRNGQGGHSHNDQLCAELQIDAADWVRDPGTYVYTALPERRNQYRSVKAHFAPQSGDCEPAPLDRGLFALPDQTKATAISFGPKEFVGMHYGYGKPTYRFVFLNETGVTIVDYLPREVAGDQDNTTILVRNPVNTQIPFSPGYGILASK